MTAVGQNLANLDDVQLFTAYPMFKEWSQLCCQFRNLTEPPGASPKLTRPDTDMVFSYVFSMIQPWGKIGKY